MLFSLEDKKRISILCELLRGVSSGHESVVFVWHRSEGWAIVQNQEYLSSPDSQKLVNFCSVKPHFFSHTAPKEHDFMCFHLDVSNIARILKSMKNDIRRMVWQVITQEESSSGSSKSPSSLALLQISLVSEECTMEITRAIELNTRMNVQAYFALFTDFLLEKTQYLEIKQPHIKQMKELKKNQCLFFRFADDYVTAYNEADERNISIRKNALEKYDYATLIKKHNGKNRLAIPPNFLVPQILIGLKLKDPIQLFIGDETIDDNIAVFLRTKTDSFTFISQFRSLMECEGDEISASPFEKFQQKAAAAAAAAAAIASHNNQLLKLSKTDSQHSHNGSSINIMSSNQLSQQQGECAAAYSSTKSADNQQQSPSFQIPPACNSKQVTFLRENAMIAETDRGALKRGEPQQQQQKMSYQQQVSALNSINANNVSSNQIFSIISSQQSHLKVNTSGWLGGSSFSREERDLEASLIQQGEGDKSHYSKYPASDFSTIPFYKEKSSTTTSSSKRIKESNYSEIHRIPTPQPQQAAVDISTSFTRMHNNTFINPMISQQQSQQHENSFSNFITQTARDAKYSLFKPNPAASSALNFINSAAQQGGNSSVLSRSTIVPSDQAKRVESKGAQNFANFK